MKEEMKVLTVKLTPDEWDRLEYLVKKTGLNTRTAYVKAALFNKTIKVVKTNLATERILAAVNSAKRSVEAASNKIVNCLPACTAPQNYGYLNKVGEGLKQVITNFGELINQYEDLAAQEQEEVKENEL